MAPKRKVGPIPAGWTLKTAVQKDGSKISFYYCPGTGQHFYTYFELMRYVEYAKSEGLGIYAPGCKSVKRIKSLEKENQKEKKSSEKDSTVTKSRKTSSVLPIRRKPSVSNSSTVEQRMDSQSSTSSESSDREKDQDYVPESDSNVTADSETSDPDFEVNQVLNAELDDLKSDDSATD